MRSELEHKDIRIFPVTWYTVHFIVSCFMWPHLERSISPIRYTMSIVGEDEDGESLTQRFSRELHYADLHVRNTGWRYEVARATGYSF